MTKIAVLVDAAYLLVASAELVSKRLPKRHQIVLRTDEVVLALIAAASMAEPADDLLRIYWYDAPFTPDTPSEDQLEIARKRSCKLRLGTRNRFGNQKGVDTLMVLDMLALARNKAVSSLLVVSGDDDLRPAIEQVQELGVRVHLLGIKPVAGQNQAVRLQRECNSSHDWAEGDVAEFVSVTDGNELWRAPDTVSDGSGTGVAAGLGDDEWMTADLGDLGDALKDTIEPLKDAIVHALKGSSEQDRLHVIENTTDDFIAIPQHIDRKLLGRFGAKLDRVLTEDEKKAMRRALYIEVCSRMRAHGEVRH